MSTLPVFVGLDYHQDSVQICVLDPDGKILLNRSCDNDWRQITAAVTPLGKVKRAAIEACCGAAALTEELVGHGGWHVDLAHPQYVAKLKQSPDKSDFTDSRMLGDLTRVGYLPRVYLASAYERDLRQLVNHRQDLVDQRRAVKLRVGALLREHRAKPPQKCSRWCKAWIAWAKNAKELSDNARWIVQDLLEELEHLNKKVTSAEKRLRNVAAADPQIERLMNEPGIGEVTAWVMRAYIGRFDRFNSGKQLSRYCGLSPCNVSSGKRQSDAGLIKGCNKVLRMTLIQAAQRLIMHEERWRELSRQMRSRGKPGSVTVAAVANRWVRGLWHRMKNPVSSGKEEAAAKDQQPVMTQKQ